ncbi:hypothetical protein BWK60_02020 [Flavobacterium covae]|uniref:hypothetical protein n=1 Tax=Flavobacterium covae TaxID=2906076 RepID=UPI000B4CD598|nr:hypothetical protein [Flavobacterium covae]OWP87790.1 hypothetical protein BWK60_02020 [Flavobacterium covae]
MNDITKRFLEAYEYLKNEGKIQNPKEFAKEIGVSTSLITEICKKRTNAGITPIQNTLIRFEEIDANWLLTGKGKMLKLNIEVIETDTKSSIVVELLTDKIKLFEKNSEMSEKQIAFLESENTRLKQELANATRQGGNRAAG